MAQDNTSIHTFELIFSNNETGVRKVLKFTAVKPSGMYMPDFFSYAWEDAIHYGTQYPNHTLLGMCLIN